MENNKQTSLDDIIDEYSPRVSETPVGNKEIDESVKFTTDDSRHLGRVDLRINFVTDDSEHDIRDNDASVDGEGISSGIGSSLFRKVHRDDITSASTGSSKHR